MTNEQRERPRGLGGGGDGTHRTSTRSIPKEAPAVKRIDVCPTCGGRGQWYGADSRWACDDCSRKWTGPNPFKLRRDGTPPGGNVRIDCAPKENSSAQSIFTPQTVAELLAHEDPETRWRWEAYAPEGGLILLAALPKGGKTTFAYHLAKAVTCGTPFLGKPTQQAHVLILALEERRQDVANRLRKLGVTEGVDIHCGPLKAATAIDAVVAFVREKRSGLIIIDTARRFWGVGDENDAALIGEALAPILALARETGVTVLLLHHLRKSPGDEGSDISGSGDIFAHVDVALTLRRRGEGQANQRLLRAFSRYDETPDEIVIALEEGEYEVLGRAGEVQANEQRDKVLTALSNEPLKADEVAVAAEMPEGTTRTILKKLHQEGVISRTGSGKRGDAYYYTFGKGLLGENNYCAQPDLYSAQSNNGGDGQGKMSPLVALAVDLGAKVVST
jgi:hypothetical protein